MDYNFSPLFLYPVMENKRKRGARTEAFVRVLSAILVVAFVSGGGAAVWKYVQRHISHEKLATVHCLEEWSVGEYRECNSMNLREQDSKPELYCVVSSRLDLGKVFKVSSSGDLTYDDEKQEGQVLEWLCRRNIDDPTFSCAAKETSSVQATPKPAERELTPDEIENSRKRNECEQRFYSRKIYELDGMSIMRACKQNPDRKP